uniref:Uncharacterized protein n=1 Tax=Avena sativa TaxID=4498 RepID=A0ACD5TH93_AVESA
MASRRFLDYDPFGYYHYPSPSYYHNPSAFQEPAVRHRSPRVYYRQRPDSARSPTRNGGFFFWDDDESPEPVMREVLRPRPRSSRSVSSVPVQFVGYDFEPERKTVAVPKKRVPSPEEATVMVQAAARGFVARRMVRAVRAVEREAEVVATRLAAEADALRVDSRGRIAIGEELMRLLFRLDAVRGVTEYRKKVTKKVLALQDAVDALEAKPAQAAAEAETVEMSAVESGMMVPELPQSREQDVQIGSNVAPDSSAVETTAAEMDMEVNGGRAVEADSAAATETFAAESTIVGEEATEAEAEWEMVTEDDALDGENPQSKAQQQEAVTKKKTEAASADGLDAKKVIEMVAALCERSVQQCELIGALAERVDMLERTVRRVEEADRRRQRIKKIKTEGKINDKAAKNFYCDL